ncbi:MAG: T9SS type A sorting domain-containing protein [Flavobacteriales bacterium]|nr:T9SS type A sorting domain-containing protein [Flavobacteriales bacterium]
MLKKIRFIIVAILFIISTYSFGQSLIPIPSPSGYDAEFAGLFSEAVTYKNNVYGIFRENPNGNPPTWTLFKYDGNSLIEIPAPQGYNYYSFNSSTFFNQHSMLHIRLQDTSSSELVLAQFDGANFNVFPNNQALFPLQGFTGKLCDYNGFSYLSYTLGSGPRTFIKFDGITMDTVQNVPNGIPSNALETGGLMYLFFGNNLYKFDGIDFTSIAEPSGYTWDAQQIFSSGSDIYLRGFDSNTGNGTLIQYDGTNVNVIPSPAGYDGPVGAWSPGYKGSPVTFNTQLFFRYESNIGDLDLVKYDGTSFTPIAAPTGYKTLVHQHMALGLNLLLGYVNQSDSITDLVLYNGVFMTPVPDSSRRSYRGARFNIGNEAFLNYYDQNSLLVKFNGTDLSFYNSPVGYDSAFAGWRLPWSYCILNNEIYLKYMDNDRNTDLMKFSLYPNSFSEIDKRSFEFNCFPNPNNGSFWIQSDHEIDSYSIFDVSGQKLYDRQVKGNLFVESLSLQSGTYFINAQRQNIISTKRFIVE